ncbi:MAG: hypothetical protein ACI9WU_003881 [Myxococcota bacterium]
MNQVAFTLAAGVILLASSASAQSVSCENDYGSCTQGQDTVSCSCDGGDTGGSGATGGSSTGGDTGTPMTDEELLAACIDELESICGSDNPPDPTDSVTCSNADGECSQGQNGFGCSCNDGPADGAGDGGGSGGGSTGGSGGGGGDFTPEELLAMCLDNLDDFCGPGEPGEGVTCETDNGSCTQMEFSVSCSCAGGADGGGGVDGGGTSGSTGGTGPDTDGGAPPTDEELLSMCLQSIEDFCPDGGGEGGGVGSTTVGSTTEGSTTEGSTTEGVDTGFDSDDGADDPGSSVTTTGGGTSTGPADDTGNGEDGGGSDTGQEATGGSGTGTAGGDDAAGTDGLTDGTDTGESTDTTGTATTGESTAGGATDSSADSSGCIAGHGSRSAAPIMLLILGSALLLGVRRQTS